MKSQRSVFGLVLAVAIAATAGCGDKKGFICKVGEVHDCRCPSGRASLQACTPQGTWGACMCNEVSTTAGTGAAGMTAGTTAGGGMSGTGAGTGADSAVPDPSDAAMSTDGGMTMGDGATGAGDAATAPPDYSNCTTATCPMGEACDTTGKFCAAECMLATDCPAAPDGAATAVCVGPGLTTKGRCALSCTTLPADNCPAGMTCKASGLLTMACGW